MFEVEMKVRAGHDDVRERLQAGAGSLRRVVFQEDTYFDAPHRSFAETDEALRVRREADLGADAPRGVDAVSDALDAGTFDSRVTYKGPLVDDRSKTRREVETGVDDGASMGSVFEALGFEPAATVAKRREFWSVDATSAADADADGAGGVTVTLDDVAGLGEFVECELETDDDVDAARERVAATLRDLGLDPDAQIRTSYLGLLLDADS